MVPDDSDGRTERIERGIFEIVDTKSFAPADHLQRKIDTAIDWCKLYELVELLY